MRALSKVLASVLLGVLLVTAGCGGSTPPLPPPSVSLYVTNAELTGGQTSAISASITNDFLAQGVTWSLTGDGSLTYPPQSFLSSPKTDCFYNAPANVSKTFTVTVLATSIRDATKTASTTLTVYPNVTISKDPLPDATAGSPYSYQLTGGGGKGGPFNYVLVEGPLPAGLTLSIGGLISGTPTVTGTYRLTIQDQDTSFSFPGAATYTYTLSVI